MSFAPESIDLAEDRDRFHSVMKKLGIPQPESGMATAKGIQAIREGKSDVKSLQEYHTGI